MSSSLSHPFISDQRPLADRLTRRASEGFIGPNNLIFSRPHGNMGSLKANFLKGLILAQNERWRRGLGMQVERIPGGLLSGGSGERGSKAWVTYPGDRDSPSNGGVIPGDPARGHLFAGK